MANTEGLIVRGFGRAGTDGLIARGFRNDVVPPEEFTAEIRPSVGTGVEFDFYETAGIGVQFTITREET